MVSRVNNKNYKLTMILKSIWCKAYCGGLMKFIKAPKDDEII